MNFKFVAIIIFGGRGFVGQAICKELKRAKTFGLEPDNDYVGSIMDSLEISRAVKKGDIVINLVGLSPVRIPNHPYSDLHVEGVKKLLEVCKRKKVKKIIHMSALGANPAAPTEYLRTKGQGEDLVRISSIPSVIFKPSLIFDKGNELMHMINRFMWTGFFPGFKAQLMPIYRKDMARLFALAVKGKIRSGTYEVVGPEALSIFEMAQLIFAAQGKRAKRIPLFLVKLGMNFARLLPGLGIGKDQIQSITLDNVAENQLKKKIKYTTFSSWVKKTYRFIS